MMPRLAFVLAAFASALPALGADPAESPKHTNRLVHETSPYLRMHAHNPTDWYPWGPEAFAKARKEGKLVFLSVGYSSCYWCHVMERESFSNERVAKVLNDAFVCIKVDREERPEIDHLYMTALLLIRGGGGWPMSMFLLPDGRPVIGGTYWPREDRKEDGETQPGFVTVLERVRDAYRDDPKNVEAQAERIAAATKRELENAGKGVALVPLDRKLVDGVVEALEAEFDPEYGGFGSPIRKFRGARFPMPPRLEFLLQQAEHKGHEKLGDMVTLTLDKMLQGGIYDQVGGGFHRYSTERTWTVPHFEKMLYDNAQLVQVYARAYRRTGAVPYRRVVEETVAYLEREMLSPDGAFASSQDAETHHEEGRYYVWTDEELTKALPKQDVDLVRKVYAADKGPNFEGKYHVLRLSGAEKAIAADLKIDVDTLQRRLDPLRHRLLEARSQRQRPLRNDVALTGWSGLMIAGLAEAGAALKEPRFMQLATRSADFLLDKQRTAEGKLLRTYGAAPGQKPRAAVPGYLEDYVGLVHGLLALHEADGGHKWLDAAKSLTDVMIRDFGDEKGGGYYYTAHDHEKFFARSKDSYDGPQPSGNGLAALNLVRLWKATGEDRYRREAERTLQAFAGTLRDQPSNSVSLAQALDLYLAEKERRP